MKDGRPDRHLCSDCTSACIACYAMTLAKRVKFYFGPLYSIFVRLMRVLRDVVFVPLYRICYVVLLVVGKIVCMMVKLSVIGTFQLQAGVSESDISWLF